MQTRSSERIILSPGQTLAEPRKEESQLTIDLLSESRVEEEKVSRLDQPNPEEDSQDQQSFFPFKPYEVQNQIMDRLDKAIRQKQHALLESPTGTGKTLALLAGALEAVRKVKKQEGVAPQIIYTSRTFQQLEHVSKELNRIDRNSTDVRSILLGSRDKLCVNKKLLGVNGQALNLACKQKKTACQYYQGVKSSNDFSLSNIEDIEDLHKRGEKLGVCPFFQNRNDARGAEVVLIPYNYLVDPAMQANMQINLSNAVIIIDEAHNIVKSCEDAMSIKLSETDLKQITEGLSFIKPSVDKSTFALSQVLIDAVTHITSKLQTLLKTKDLARKRGSLTYFLTGGDPKARVLLPNSKYLSELDDKIEIMPVLEMVRFLEEAEIGLPPKVQVLVKDKMLFLEVLEQIFLEMNKAKLWCENAFCTFIQLQRIKFNYIQGLGRRRVIQIKEASQSSFSQLLLDESVSFKKSEINSKSSISSSSDGVGSESLQWKAGFMIDEQVNYKRETPIRSFQIQNFDASFSMQDILRQKPRSVILASGTLPPKQRLQEELGLEFKFELRGEHVISPQQISLSIIESCELPNGDLLEFDLSSKNQGNAKVISALGKTINRLAAKTDQHAGVLVFFPSYFFLENCRKEWRYMNFCKSIKFEERDQDTGKIYKDHIMDCKEGKGGSILAAVFRAQFAEGIDFIDDQSRLVIIAGVPLPPLGDPYVVIKSSLRAIATKSRDWFQWSVEQAMLAVNQALGRTIRHAKDYGSIVLIDSRYATNNSLSSQLSSWLQDLAKDNQCPTIEQAEEQINQVTKFGKNLGLEPVINKEDKVGEVRSSGKSQEEEEKEEEQELVEEEWALMFEQLKIH